MSTGDSAQSVGRESLRRAVSDAQLLLDYAIATGAPVGPEIIAAIRQNAAISDAGSESAMDRLPFDKAYRDLAQLMRPVSAWTLHSTSRPEPSQPSEAERWSRKLWSATVGTLLVIILGEAYSIVGTGFVAVTETLEGDVFSKISGPNHVATVLLGLVLPFAYGTLGACAYLLRSCHKALYRRTFDPLRKAEYLNRILLGAVSGGASALLFREVIETNIQLGGAAIAFLAGYHTDFLFTTVERIVAAVFPKVEPQEAKAETPEPNPEDKIRPPSEGVPRD